MSEGFNRPKMQPRNALYHRLQEAVELPLCIVCAPLGYGKTTLIREYLSMQKNTAAVWYTMNSYEEDSEWLWQKIMAQMVAAQAIKDTRLAEYSFPTTNRERQNIVYALEKAICKTTFLVLDDCHQCMNRAWYQWLEVLAYARIPKLHLILIGRAYPDLPYEEMEMKALCLVINQRMLQLSHAEIAGFFEINQCSIPQETVNEIYEYTEGWAAAVYLILLDYRQNGRIDNHDRILSLVRTSVFCKFSGEQRRILAIMSAFDCFTDQQAEAITRIPGCKQALREIASSTHFVKVEVLSHVYTVHAMLRTVAAEMLYTMQITEGEIAQRGGEWFESQGQFIEACFFYAGAKAHEAIFRVLEKTDAMAQYEKAPDTFVRFFQEMPFAIKAAHLQVYFLFLYYRLLYMQGEETTALCQELLQFYQKGSEQGNVGLRILEVLLTDGDLEKMIELVQQGREQKSYLPVACMDMFSFPETYMMFYKQCGTLQQVFQNLQRFMPGYLRLNQQPEGGWLRLFEAQYALVIGQAEKALEQINISLTKAQLQESQEAMIAGSFCKMRALLYLGRRQEFQEFWESFRVKKGKFSSNSDKVAYDTCIKYICTLTQTQEQMEPWAPKSFKVFQGNAFFRALKSGCIVWGQLLIAEKRFAELEALAENMQEGGPYIHLRIVAKIYSAIAVWNMLDSVSACNRLREALQLAQADQDVLWFAENARHILPIFRTMTLTDPFHTRVLQIAEQYPVYPEKETVGQVQLLTDREREIMELVAQGLRNNEISKRLFIALVTVEKNLTNVYRKLGVTNRTAAILQYQKIQKS